jgi:hypothetical protein
MLPLALSKTSDSNFIEGREDRNHGGYDDNERKNLDKDLINAVNTRKGIIVLDRSPIG